MSKDIRDLKDELKKSLRELDKNEEEIAEKNIELKDLRKVKEELKSYREETRDKIAKIDDYRY